MPIIGLKKWCLCEHKHNIIQLSPGNNREEQL